MNMLSSISDSSMPAAKLQGLKFSDFFRWLSASMTTLTNAKDGEKVNLAFLFEKRLPFGALLCPSEALCEGGAK